MPCIKLLLASAETCAPRPTGSKLRWTSTTNMAHAVASTFAGAWQRAAPGKQPSPCAKPMGPTAPSPGDPPRRALLEGWASGMWSRYSGMVIWKTQNPWAGLRGQLYDWLLAQTDGLYGARAACEPLHVQLNLHTLQARRRSERQQCSKRVPCTCSSACTRCRRAADVRGASAPCTRVVGGAALECQRRRAASLCALVSVEMHSRCMPALRLKAGSAWSCQQQEGRGNAYPDARYEVRGHVMRWRTRSQWQHYI